MAPKHRLISAAFLLAVFATACDRQEQRPDTVMQPHAMPAPAAPTVGPAARDSAATKPLNDLDSKKENTGMPEAGHGNNHSSPAFKKSSTSIQRPPKVAWI